MYSKIFSLITLLFIIEGVPPPTCIDAIVFQKSIFLVTFKSLM